LVDVGRLQKGGGVGNLKAPTPLLSLGGARETKKRRGGVLTEKTVGK